MKKELKKYIIIGILSIVTIALLFVNAIKVINGFWSVNVSEGIEIFILIFVSYYLVDRQNYWRLYKGIYLKRKILNLL